jgi:hypothetical protein
MVSIGRDVLKARRQFRQRLAWRQRCGGRVLHEHTKSHSTRPSDAQVAFAK